MYPRLCIDVKKLQANGKMLCELAASRGIPDLAFVTKSFCAIPELVAALEELPNPYLADSRIENLKRYPPTRKQKLLLRLPMPSQAEEVVQYADLSLCSEETTLAALDAAGKKLGRTHKVVLMVDMGDLREGVFFRDEGGLLALADAAERAEHLTLFGMGFNVTCYGSVIPTEETLAVFTALREKVEAHIGRKLSFLSAGNSSSFDLMMDNRLDGFNNLRLGESLLLGRETAYGADIPQLNQDVLTLEAEVVEAKYKPSYPIGKLGVNAFGQTVQYEDRGTELRIIAAVGQQDIDFSGLRPLEPGLQVIGASSDHLILSGADRSGRADPVKVGDVLRFRPDYSAALRAFTSPYVEKILL